jgi:hypothetical protein
MTNTYSPFKTSYPSTRGPLGKIFRPVVDFRTYLWTAHMLLMFPLGVAYFVFFAVSLSVGISLVWTLIGPVILLATLFISRWIGDLEAFTSGYINETAIRRPPSRLEGVSNFRSQVKVRLVDPTTWTGIVYLAAQFPIGIAAFVGVVVMYSVVGAATFAPLIMSLTDEPIVIFSATFSTATDALIFTPIGILGFIIASHVVLTFSSLHGWWARLMLGSRSTRVSRELAPVPGGDGPGGVADYGGSWPNRTAKSGTRSKPDTCSRCSRLDGRSTGIRSEHGPDSGADGPRTRGVHADGTRRY